MPYAPMTQNQVPEIMMRAGENFGSGVGRGLAMMGAKRDAMMERDRAEAKEAKRTRAIAKMFKDDWGLGDSDVEKLDADTLKGMMEGHFLKNTQTGQRLQRENTELRNGLMRSQQTGMALFNRIMQGQMPGSLQTATGTETATNGAAPEDVAKKSAAAMMFMQTGQLPPAENFDAAPYMVNPSIAAGRPAGASPSGAFSPQAIMGAAAQSGILTPHEVLSFMQHQKETGMDVTPKEVNIGGKSWVYSPKTGAFQRNFDPTAFMGEGTPGVRRVPVLDEAGEPTREYLVPNGKGGFTKSREKTVAPNTPWLFTDDEEEFKAGIAAVENPKERDALLQARTQYIRALGKPDALADLIAEVGGKKKPAKAETPAASSGGKKLKYNPATGKLE